MSRKIKVGDRVRILEPCSTSLFEVGDIVNVVAKIDSGSGNCPFYLSKDKERKLGNHFGPWAYNYELMPINNNMVGGELL